MLSTGGTGPRCVVVAPYSFSGRGPAESCAQIAGGMAAAGLRTELWAGRVRVRPAAEVDVHAAVPVLGPRLPWRAPVEGPSLRLLEARVRHVVRTADPRTTVVHVWPGTPARLVARMRDHGLMTVREMINSPMATARPILDAAYARLGLAPTHGVTAAAAADESAELELYDHFFASNPEVERGLLALGIRPEQILPTTFGWHPERYAGAQPIERARGVRATFVGRIGVRKGVPELLDAWARLDVDGELLLVGAVDDEITGLVDEHVRSGRVRLHGYAHNPGAVYAASDLFVFPTLEEGGPQVTYEAAGFGLPVVTTPMGAARLVEDGRTGLVVPAGSVDDLTTALGRLATDADARRTMGAAAARAAAEFTYRLVGARRAAMLRALRAAAA